MKKLETQSRVSSALSLNLERTKAELQKRVESQPQTRTQSGKPPGATPLSGLPLFPSKGNISQAKKSKRSKACMCMYLDLALVLL